MINLRTRGISTFRSDKITLGSSQETFEMKASSIECQLDQSFPKEYLRSESTSASFPMAQKRKGKELQ
ncbi:unnamed protein product [Dovyalis caffra]|uniref:Uncharacterized protein n=1 Tax=Dovyalis caffra TaxID=77055 RepID=A0AAV1RC70_9ROSI|nr:unnamed protein product [Dovyalis caffra]